MALNAQDVAAKWSRNLAGATQSIKDGVMAVQTAPTQMAAARADAFVQGVQQSVASGKWQAGLNRVSLSDWQQQMINKGINRIATGAQGAQPKFAAFMGQLLPYIDNGKRTLAATPRGDLGTNIQRMVNWVQYMSQFRRTQ
jgi:hypothetical protein